MYAGVEERNYFVVGDRFNAGLRDVHDRVSHRHRRRRVGSAGRLDRAQRFIVCLERQRNGGLQFCGRSLGNDTDRVSRLGV